MAVGRESVYSALFAKLLALRGPYFVTVSRRLKHWADCDHVQQPALYMAQVGETVSQTQSIPRKLEIGVELYLYTFVQTALGDEQSPMPVANALVDAVEQIALAPDTGDATRPVCTLGGLAQRCWIEGDIRTDEGVLGPQSVIVIPVRILVVG